MRYLLLRVDEVFTIKGYDELVQMVDEHIAGSGDSVEPSQPNVLPAATHAVPAIESVPTPAASPAQPANDSDAEIKDLLAGLDL
jgi:hypothetical protein